MQSRWGILCALFILSWITYLDRAAISSAKDALAGELNLNDQQIGLVFSAFALGYALCQVPAGWFADWIGPRRALTIVVTGWSLFTAWTGLVSRLWVLVVVRFLFGVAEAGAYPGSARVIYNWLPTEEHGRANGIIFAGSRLGAALAFPLFAWLLSTLGWRPSFVLLALPGLLWSAIWMLRFQDYPPQAAAPGPARRHAETRLGEVLRSRAMALAMLQYFCSNFTNFLSLSWMNPFLMQHYRLSRETAAWCTMAVLLVGATSQWVSGWMTDRLYASRFRAHSRQIPAIAGFLISAVGLVIIAAADEAVVAVAGFCLAAFGAELTISPSWAYCIDLGGLRSGAVSGSMNMVGNLGSFVSANAFPWLYKVTGKRSAYFLTAALLNCMAAAVWTRMRSVSRK